MSQQLELPFTVIDGGKPSPYTNFRSKFGQLDKNSEPTEKNIGSDNTGAEQRVLAVDGGSMS